MNQQQNPTDQYHSVHASAGSGKTYHLVSHMVRLLIQGAEPASILAITFTRKAAAEMQGRLLERVYELAVVNEEKLSDLLATSFELSATDEYRTQARNLYESLLHANQGVRTTTFHAFCQDLLRRFPMEAEIPPGFELVERTGYLIDEAWNNLENELTRNPQLPIAQHFDVLLTQLGTSETRSVLNKFITARSEWWAFASQPDFEIDQYCEDLASRLDIQIGNDDPIKIYLDNNENLEELREYLRLLPLSKVRDHEKCSRLIADGLNEQDEAETRLANIWSGLFTDKGTPRSRTISGTLKKRLGDDQCSSFLNLHESLCNKLIDLHQQRHAHETLSLTRAWLHAGKAFVERYQTIKTNHRHLDFSDLEWQCYCLLNASDHADWIQYKLDQRIDHLLVDEFQDTNQTQWQLILPLLKELASAKQERLRSVLFVGDSKQSIYQFRRAEPKLFQAASQWIEKNLGADKQFLACSYRSSPAIVKFVNQLFTDNRSSQLDDFQTHETVRNALSGAVELLPLTMLPNSKKENTETDKLRNPLETPLVTTDSAHFLEAQLAATTISKLIERKLIVHEGDEARYIEYGDIMILLRNRTHAADYERALREAHIPYMGTERGTLLESLEIKDMVNLLQWLITPFDNHALAGVLRSPIFSTTETDLYPLVGQTNWFEYILQQQADLIPGSPLARAALHLQNWMALTEILPVHDLLDKIFSEGNVIERYKANYPPHLHARVQANLIRFIELALENDSGRYPSLTRFLAWLRLLKQQDQEAPDQPASDNDLNRVRILTIHESKGLESPVVFLLDATTTKRNRGGASVLIDWPCNQDANEHETAKNHPIDFVISPSAAYPHPYCDSLIQQQHEKEQQEEANLLYVAVTRAQQYLYLSGSGKSAGWYENICRQYNIDEEQLTNSQCLEEYTGTITQPVIPTSTLVTNIQTDPRLQQPVQLANKRIEISPSTIKHAMDETRQPVEEASNARPLDNEESEHDARQRGIIIHRMIEMLAGQPELSLQTFCRINQLDEHSDLLTEYWQQAVQSISHFPAYFQDEYYRVAYSEVPVCYQNGKVLVSGIIDRLVIKDDEVTVIDFKTHPLTEDQNIDVLASQFRSQLALYKEAVALLYPGRSIKTQVLFTSLPACIELSI